jgi:hypothetical protein
MKSIIAILTLAGLLVVPVSLHADTFGLSLKTGGATDVLVSTPILNGTQYTYTNTTLGALKNSALQASTSLVTVTYVQTGLFGTLNVNDVCTTVTVFGSMVPCETFTLSFTNLTLGDLTLDNAVGMNASLDVGSGLLTFGGNHLVLQSNVAGISIAGGSSKIDFNQPPTTDPSVGQTPEPATLLLMVTGLAGAAFVIRKRVATVF